MHRQPANDRRPAEVSEPSRTAHAIHPVDGFVAAKIRLRRKGLRMSQRRLADQIGTTFQQVQKYENGTNRVSASRLVAIAKALGTSVHWFFDGAGPQASLADRSPFIAPSIDDTSTAEVRELVSLWPEMTVRQRHSVLQLVRDLSNTPSSARIGREA